MEHILSPFLRPMLGGVVGDPRRCRCFRSVVFSLPRSGFRACCGSACQAPSQGLPGLCRVALRSFPCRRLFGDAWPTEKRTASTSSSWPVTPTCCLTSGSRSPQVALLELLLHQRLGQLITVLRIESNSGLCTDCSAHTVDNWHSAAGLEHSESEWIS